MQSPVKVKDYYKSWIIIPMHDKNVLCNIWKILIWICLILEVRKAIMYVCVCVCVHKCLYICVCEIMEQSTRSPPLLTPMHIQQFPRPLLPFITHWEGSQSSQLLLITVKGYKLKSAKGRNDEQFLKFPNIEFIVVLFSQEHVWIYAGNFNNQGSSIKTHYCGAHSHRHDQLPIWLASLSCPPVIQPILQDPELLPWIAMLDCLTCPNARRLNKLSSGRTFPRH